MQIISYRVRFINSNGGVVEGGSAEFIDSVPVKKATVIIAEENQRNPDNVILTETGRTAV